MHHFLKMRNKRRTAVLLTLFVLCMTYGTAYAREHESSFSFCGGMFYQAGWYRINTPVRDVSGFSSGLGGKLGFYVSPSIRLGAMGFSSSLRYDRGVHAPSSYISTGAGGLTAEWVRHIRALRLVPGVMMGGGHVEQLHIIAVNEGFNTVSYEDHTIFLIAAMLSLEYPLSDKITATFMTDWLFGTATDTEKYNGPSLRLGILFTH